MSHTHWVRVELTRGAPSSFLPPINLLSQGSEAVMLRVKDKDQRIEMLRAEIYNLRVTMRHKV